MASIDDSINSRAKGFGYTTLGPIVIAFAHLLLRAARRREVRRLMFVARDGQLLQSATRIVAEATGTSHEFAMGYLHLSRRATRLAATGQITEETISEAMAVRAGPLTVGKLLESHGISPAQLPPRLFGDPQRPIDNRVAVERITALLSDEEVTALIEHEGRKQRALIVRYLRQEGLRNEPWSIVDVGWRGTIQRNLARIVEGTTPSPSGLYLGLIADADRPAQAEGILSDCHERGRTLREAAAWHASLLLESVFRADEGTTVGYVDSGKGVQPVLAEVGPARAAEIACEPLASNIREGILQYVHTYAGYAPIVASTDQALRSRAQTSLLRLAFFPTREQLALAKHLVHTESHAPDWSMPLVIPPPRNPVTAPRAWLRGLSSPWRAGYVAASGGTALAAANAIFQAALLRLPCAAERTVARVARRLAGLA